MFPFVLQNRCSYRFWDRSYSFHAVRNNRLLFPLFLPLFGWSFGCSRGRGRGRAFWAFWGLSPGRRGFLRVAGSYVKVEVLHPVSELVTMRTVELNPVGIFFAAQLMLLQISGCWNSNITALEGTCNLTRSGSFLMVLECPSCSESILLVLTVMIYSAWKPFLLVMNWSMQIKISLSRKRLFAHRAHKLCFLALMHWLDMLPQVVSWSKNL